MIKASENTFGAALRCAGFRRTLLETAPINFYYCSAAIWKSTTIAGEWLAKTGGLPDLGMPPVPEQSRGLEPFQSAAVALLELPQSSQNQV